jgi:hypothetical protein
MKESVILSGESRNSVILSVLREGSYEATESQVRLQDLS